MKFDKLMKCTLALICLAFMLCACNNSAGEKAFNEEEMQTYVEMFHKLEDIQTEGETLKEVKGEELKNVDFTDCSIAVLDHEVVKIYERLSEEKTKEFVNLLVQAEIGSEENYKDWPKRNGGSSPRQFQITLKDGDRLYVGILYSDDNRSFIAINDDLAYECDDKTAKSIDAFSYDALRRFEDTVRAALTQS